MRIFGLMSSLHFTFLVYQECKSSTFTRINSDTESMILSVVMENTHLFYSFLLFIFPYLLSVSHGFFLLLVLFCHLSQSLQWLPWASIPPCLCVMPPQCPKISMVTATKMGPSPILFYFLFIFNVITVCRRFHPCHPPPKLLKWCLVLLSFISYKCVIVLGSATNMHACWKCAYLVLFSYVDVC